jgi:hypothetical protein
MPSSAPRTTKFSRTITTIADIEALERRPTMSSCRRAISTSCLRRPRNFIPSDRRSLDGLAVDINSVHESYFRFDRSGNLARLLLACREDFGIVGLMALYLHLGPFSRRVIAEIDRRIAAEVAAANS